MPTQPQVPIWFAAVILVGSSVISFVVAGGHAVGIPDLQLFALAAVNVGLTTLLTFLNIRRPGT